MEENNNDILSLSSERKFLKGLINNLPDAIIVIGFDGKILRVNKRAEVIFNYSKLELIGSDIEIIIPVRLRAHHVKARMEMLQSEELPLVRSSLVTGLRKDGTEFPVEIIVTPVDIDEKYVICVVRDLSEKHRRLSALALSESRYRILFNSVAVGVLQYNNNLIITDNNDKLEEILNVPKDFFLRKSIRDLVTPDVVEYFERALKGNEIKIEGPYKSFFNASSAWYSLKISPIYSQQEIISAVALIEDITQKVVREEAIKDSETRFRSLVENIHNIAVYGCNEKREVIYWNKACEIFYRFSAAEVLGKQIEELIFADASKASIVETIDNIFYTGNSIPALKLTVRRKDGTLFPVQSSFVMLRNNKNEKELFCLDIDLSELKTAYQKLREQDKYLQVLVNQLPVMMWSVDSELKITSISGADIQQLNMPADEYLGKTLYEIFQTNDDTFLPVASHLKALRGESSTYEKVYKSKTVLIFLEPIKSENNEIIGCLRLGVDITKQKEAELALKEVVKKTEEMNNLKSNFLANMSHELRTPMVGILGYADILRHDGGKEFFTNIGSSIYKSGIRLLETLNKILDLSNIENNKVSFNPVENNLIDCITECIDSNIGYANEKSLYLQVNVDKKVVCAAFDKIAFQNILNNLINNAIKYTEQGGVTVSVYEEIIEGVLSAIITIEDTGIGIPGEFHSLIFEEFRQVSEGLGRNFDGTGLGLTLAKKYIEKMNGKIYLESTLNKGSKFTIVFPVSHSDYNRGLKNNSQSAISGSKAETVLEEVMLVEDDAINQKVIKACLKSLCNLSIVSKGVDAIKLAKEKKFSAILMDINLGRGLNGLETAAEIRNIPGYENTPIAAITAFAMKGDKEEFLAKGCTHYISKPFNKRRLVSFVKDLLGR